MRRTALAFATVLLVAPLAGCLGAVPPDARSTGDAGPGAAAEWLDRLSEPLFDSIVHEELDVPGHDGAVIRLDVYRPDLGEGGIDRSDWKAPVILVYSPYFEGSKDAGDANRPGGVLGWLIDHFAPRGYAVVMADARGTRASGGCMQVAGPDEIKDGAAVVEDLAAREWSNGRVGMFGISYPARTQFGVAILDPEGLETIVPLAGISDYYSYLLFDGVPRDSWVPFTMVGYSQRGLMPHASADAVQRYPERTECWPDNFRHGSADLSGEWNQFWEARDYNARAANVNASLWMVHGFEDWNVVPDSAIDYFDLVDVPKRAWLMQMGHNYPHYNWFQPEWSRLDFEDELHRWYDHWLLGKDVGLDGEATVQVQDSSGRWRTAEAWPPADAASVAFHLTAEGELVADEAGSEAPEAGQRSYSAFPEDTVGTAPPMTGPGRLVYTSDPLDEPLHFAGSPTLDLHVSLDGASTHVAWHLYSETPAGERVQLTRGYLDTRYRDGVRNGPEPVEPGEVVALSLRTHPQDDVVPVGHRLVVTLQPDDPWSWPDTSDDAARWVTVHHGADAPSALVLPVVDPPADAFFEAEMGEPE